MYKRQLQWQQFRRLLLGTVTEALIAARVELDFPSVRIDFDPRSRFEVPRFNNYMRFSGAFEAELSAPLPADARAHIEGALRRSWLDLLQSIDLPVGDRLTNEKADLAVTVEPGDGAGRLRVAFDLIAD